MPYYTEPLTIRNYQDPSKLYFEAESLQRDFSWQIAGVSLGKARAR